MNHVREVFCSKNKIHIRYSDTERAPTKHYFGQGELADMLSFGYSYVEHADHCVEYLLVNPDMARRIIREISDVTISFDSDYIGQLWTAGLYVTDRVQDDTIIFANLDKTVVLVLNTNKIGDPNGDL